MIGFADHVFTQALRGFKRVCEGLDRRDHRGRTVTLKLRYGDFTTISRSLTLEHPTADASVVLVAARELLRRTQAGEEQRDHGHAAERHRRQLSTRAPAIWVRESHALS